MNPKRIYNSIRPILQRIGLLNLARRIFSSGFRATVAKRMGLGGYIKPFPSRVPYEGTVQANSLNFMADMRADIGVGESARAIYSALLTTGIQINYQEIETPLVQRTTEITPTSTKLKPSISLVHINPPELHLGLEQYPQSFQDSYTIGYWLWEVPRFPEEWLSRLTALDELWTSSRYTKDILSKVANIPVFYVPIPVIVNPEAVTRAQFGIPEDRFIFFFAFNPGSSVARKNPYGLIEAYKRAFSGMTDRPLLVIKAHHLARHPLIAVELRQAIQEIGGILIENHLTRSEMHGLINLSDCVISLHRAEGFGLLMAEAMAMGKPVIATGYSSNMDFMTEQNSFSVHYSLRDITEDDHKNQPSLAEIYGVGQLWAEPDVNHAAQLMQHIFSDSGSAQERGKRAKQDLENGWNTEAVGQIISHRLKQIAQAHP